MGYKLRYRDEQLQNAYVNACKCIEHRYWKRYWNNCGLDRKESEKVWEQAVEDVAPCSFLVVWGFDT